ncbi:hypothetical protein F4809DRAFT_5715 [Biscogniauxia mediterranea]|nr:hypothetical protein F4809DRAFT_5715 [Biscogniauxia mediterranea]
MAIISGLEGLEVTILVSGTPVREYQSLEAVHSATEGNHHGVKYIEAVPGTPFSICIKKTSTYQRTSHHIGCRLVVDGKEYGYHQERGPQITSSWTKVSSASMLLDEAGQPMRVDHRFGDPRNVENGLSLPEEPTHSGSASACRYGRICVDFYRLLNPQDIIISQQLRVLNSPMGIARASSELSPFVRYPLLMTNGSTQAPVIYFQDLSRLPFASFEFRYGSRDDLVRAGISPESAASVSPESAASVSPESAASVSPESAAGVSPESAAGVSPESAAGVSPESAMNGTPEDSA